MSLVLISSKKVETINWTVKVHNEYMLIWGQDSYNSVRVYAGVPFGLVAMVENYILQIIDRALANKPWNTGQF